MINAVNEAKIIRFLNFFSKNQSNKYDSIQRLVCGREGFCRDVFENISKTGQSGEKIMRFEQNSLTWKWNRREIASEISPSVTSPEEPVVKVFEIASCELPNQGVTTHVHYTSNLLFHRIPRVMVSSATELSFYFTKFFRLKIIR